MTDAWVEKPNPSRRNHSRIFFAQGPTAWQELPAAVFLVMRDEQDWRILLRDLTRRNDGYVLGIVEGPIFDI